MKRIKAACLLQTLHFGLKEDMSHDVAVRAVQEAVRVYKMRMDNRYTRYKIEEEIPQSDGSIILKVRKQYNASPVGDYLD